MLKISKNQPQTTLAKFTASKTAKNKLRKGADFRKISYFGDRLRRLLQQHFEKQKIFSFIGSMKPKRHSSELFLMSASDFAVLKSQQSNSLLLQLVPLIRYRLIILYLPDTYLIVVCVQPYPVAILDRVAPSILSFISEYSNTHSFVLFVRTFVQYTAVCFECDDLVEILPHPKHILILSRIFSLISNIPLSVILSINKVPSIHCLIGVSHSHKRSVPFIVHCLNRLSKRSAVG